MVVLGITDQIRLWFLLQLESIKNESAIIIMMQADDYESARGSLFKKRTVA